jgi:hypothetical protein
MRQAVGRDAKDGADEEKPENDGKRDGAETDGKTLERSPKTLRAGEKWKVDSRGVRCGTGNASGGELSYSLNAQR